MKTTYLQEGKGYRVFEVANVIFFVLVLFITAYPIYYVLIASFSSPSAWRPILALFGRRFSP